MSDDERSEQTKDGLYEALTEVQAHADTLAGHRKELLAKVEAKQAELGEQRDAAAKAGERATYDQASEDLAKLARAWQLLQQDPDDPDDPRYQLDDSEPTSAPAAAATSETAEAAGSGAGPPADEQTPPSPGPSPADAEAAPESPSASS